MRLRDSSTRCHRRDSIGDSLRTRDRFSQRQLILTLLSGPFTILEMAAKDEAKGEDAQPEVITCKLSEAEILLAQGETVADACRRIWRHRSEQ